MSGVETVVIFVPLSLLVGGVLRAVNKKYNIPYAPMLLVVGIIWGWIHPYIGIVGEVAEIVSQMEPVSDK
mgnify:CR=1 FL=1